MKILVTGGAGFIGSALVRRILSTTDHRVLNVDKLTYAGNLASLAGLERSRRYSFYRGDICDPQAMARLFDEFEPDAVMHLAAETHVDRSIDAPMEFVTTNIVGTSVMLEAARRYWTSMNRKQKQRFRFHHVSTDEVYGDILNGGFFSEGSRYDPSSPYSASKAGADHLVRAWARTFGLPILLTSCCNNYGPYHFPEKLIPPMILNAIDGKPLPVYGDGSNVRDWLFVDDHADALLMVLEHGRAGETYLIGGRNEISNLELVHLLCDALEDLCPEKPAGVKRYSDLICFVQDRPGHDLRYAIDTSKITRELGWRPGVSLEVGLKRTIAWYLEHRKWWQTALSGSYYHRERLGLIDQGEKIPETL